VCVFWGFFCPRNESQSQWKLKMQYCFSSDVLNPILFQQLKHFFQNILFYSIEESQIYRFGTTWNRNKNKNGVCPNPVPLHRLQDIQPCSQELFWSILHMEVLLTFRECACLPFLNWESVSSRLSLPHLSLLTNKYKIQPG